MAERSEELGEQRADTGEQRADTALAGEPDDVVCSGELLGDADAGSQLEVVRLGDTPPPSGRLLPPPHAASDAGA